MMKLERMVKNPTDAAAVKGREAALAWLAESACPYKDKRKEDGRLTTLTSM